MAETTIFTKYGVAEGKEKKTMQGALEFLEGLKNKPVTVDVIKEFADKFATKSVRATGDGTPRESVKLFDKDGNVLGRKCSVFHLWLPASEFNGDVAKMSICREANKLKTANLRAGEKIEKEALEILEQARKAENAGEKLKLFEAYDKEMEKAKQTKTAEIKVPAEYKAGFATVEELAKSLKVEAITTAPAKEDKEA
jgi:hypothetical protein